MSDIKKVDENYFSDFAKSKEVWKNQQNEVSSAEVIENVDLNDNAASSYEVKKSQLIKLFGQRQKMQDNGIKSGEEYKKNGEEIKKLREEISSDLQNEIDFYQNEINNLKTKSSTDLNNSIISTNQDAIDKLDDLLNSKISGFYSGRQSYEDATEAQKNIVDIINNPSIYKDTRPNYCQAYVNDVFQAADIISDRYACATEARWGTGDTLSTDLENIPVGACLFSDRSNPPVPCGDHDAGHVAIYIGDGMVVHNVGGVQTISVDDWISQWSVDGRNVTWGWINGKDLSE